MPTLTPTVFLASRFDELRPIRQRIKEVLSSGRAFHCHVIDLGSNHPDECPPVLISQNAARAADIMVLLVGESYGRSPKGHTRSYVHLEYEAASATDSNTIVLPYFFDAPAENRVLPRDPQVEQFRSEIRDRHTVSTYRLLDDPDVIAFEIFQDVARKRYDLAAAERQAPDDIGPEWSSADAQAVAEGLSEIEENWQIEDEEELQLEEDTQNWKVSELLAAPTYVAAAEHRSEAVRAIDLGERRIAIAELSKALKLRPLDVASLFWCARLLLISGLREDSREALEKAVRAARITDKEGKASEQNYALSACYILAARAAGQLGDGQSGVEFAQRAQLAAKLHWLTHVEVARQHALADDFPAARNWIKSSFGLRPQSLAYLQHDPAFRRFKEQFVHLKAEIVKDLARDVGAIMSQEILLWRRLYTLATAHPTQNLDSQWIVTESKPAQSDSASSEKTVPSLLRIANNSFRRQTKALSRLASHTVELHQQDVARAAEEASLREKFTANSQHVEQQIQDINAESLPIIESIDKQVFAIGASLAVGFALLGLRQIIRGAGWAGLLFLVVAMVALVVSFAHAREKRVRSATRAFETRQTQRVQEIRDVLKSATLQYNIDLDATGRRKQHIREGVEAAVPAFLRHVSQMENTCLKRRIYCATSAIHRAAPGAWVRLDPQKHSHLFTIDDELLPDHLHEWSEFEVPVMEGERHRLYCVLAGTPPLPASRRACYFLQ